MIKTSEQIETDKLLLSCTGLWEEFHINKTKDPINVQEYYNLISNLLDQQLNHSKMWLSSPQAKEYYYAEMQRQKEILQSLDMEWDDLLEQTYESVDDLIERVYELGKQKGYNDIKEKLVFTDTDKEALDFVRQYNFQLIRKLSNDLRGNVKKTITQAVATGETPYSLANKIVELGVKPLEGSTLSAKQRAVMIAKTEVSRAQNTGILQSYVNEGYTEVTILTAEDSDVCSLCLDNAYLFNKSEDKVYHPGLKDNVHRISDLDEDSMLPLHPNCRCTYLSVWKSRRDNVNPEVINLTPLSDGELHVLNNIYTDNRSSKKPFSQYSSDGITNSLSKNQFKEECKGFIDKKDMSLVDNLYEFQGNVKYVDVEFATARTKKGTFSGLISDGKSNSVNLTKKFLETAEKEKGILFLIHNHPKSNPPLPSSGDLEYFASNKVKYGLITNEEGTFIIKNNSLSQNKDNSKKIKDIGFKIEKNMTDDFNKDTGRIIPSTFYEGKPIDKYTSEEVNYFKERDKYVNEHKNRYINLYEKELSVYGFEVKFVN